MRLTLTCGLVPLAVVGVSIAAQPLLESLFPSLASAQLLGFTAASHVPTVMFVLLGAAAGFTLRPLVNNRRNVLAIFAAPSGWFLFVLWVLFGGVVPGIVLPDHIPHLLITAVAPVVGVGVGLLARGRKAFSRASV